MRCDGIYSCYDTSIISSTNGGDIYITGGSLAVNNRNIVPVLATSSEYDILCSGYNSCYNYKVQSGNNIYCLADQSCVFTNFNGGIGNIYSYGWSSTRLAIMDNINDSVYCHGYESCMQTLISNVNKMVIGYGYLVLSNSYISNINDAVVGIGYQSLYSTSISFTNSIYCYGESSCFSRILIACWLFFRLRDDFPISK